MERGAKSFKSFMYTFLKISNDINAIQKNKVGKRIGRRVYGKITGRIANKLFK